MEVLTLKGHRNKIQSVVFSPDGDKIVSGSGDRTIKIWDLSDPGLIKSSAFF